MQPLAEVAGWLFGWLLRNSAHAAILAVAIWGLERAVGPRLKPRWRYGLWLMVVARLLLPVAPESHFSLFNLVDLAPAKVAGAALQVLGLPAPVVVPVTEAPDPLADTPWWFIGALALWFSGALTLAGLAWRNHRRLRQALTATSPVLDAEILDLLRQSRAVMGVKRRVTVEESAQISSPAVSGWLRPRLLLPNDLLTRLTPDEIRFLFLHELAHVKRADLVFNWVIAVIQILHWYNPLIWFALRRLLTVREEVCDDLVLRRCFPGAAREYGLTLLRLLEECSPRRFFPAFANVLDDVGALRQRIRCIRNFGVRDHHPCVPAALTVAVAIVGLTERIAEPLLWSPRPITVASLDGRHEPSPPPVDMPGASRRLAGASVPDHEPRRGETASQFVGALAAAIQMVAAEGKSGEARPPAEEREPGLDPTNPFSPSAGLRPGGGLPAQATARPARLAVRPYPLPPVSERGDIMRPPRALGTSGWMDVPASRGAGPAAMLPTPAPSRPAVGRGDGR